MNTVSVTYEHVLVALAADRDDLVVLTAGDRGQVPGLPGALGSRFVGVGTGEQTVVGAAVSLALRGRTPVVHAPAAFLTLRAFELVRDGVGIGGLPVKLVGFPPGVPAEANGCSHEAIDDVAAMRVIPGMQVFCPADLDELLEALPRIVASRAPAYVRFTGAPPAVDHVEPFTIGKAEVLSREEGVSILTYGPLLREAEQARRVLHGRGVPVHLVNLRTLEPVDEGAIVDAVRPAELVVTLEDQLRRGGLYTIVAETCLRHRLAPRVLGLDRGSTSFAAAPCAGVLGHEGLAGVRLAERILGPLCEANA